MLISRPSTCDVPSPTTCGGRFRSQYYASGGCSGATPGAAPRGPLGDPRWSGPSPPTSGRRHLPAPVRYTRSSSSASSAGLSGGSSSQMVAIDSKIEQAMDLVKTHLMFAVREEVELLRNRMVDLESTVCHLEAENAVLRQHISDDILRNLNLNS